MQQERTLSYALAQKLDEADLEKVAGGSLALSSQLTGGPGGVDFIVDS